MAATVEIIVKAVDKASDVLKKTEGGLGGLAKSALSAVGGYAALGGAAMAAAAYIGEATKAAAANAEVVAKQEAILKATGYAAGMTAEELGNMADEMERTTAIDGDLIASAQSLMLTFRNVSGETFPRAMQAAVDLQTTFGSLEASSMQLGKALNDPVAGISALARSGVTFSESQKEQIKNFVAMNDLASAQAIILAEVENQVGGTAAAIAAAGDGSQNLTNATGALSEAIGKSALPMTRAWNKALADTAWALTDMVEANQEANEKMRERIDLSQQYTAVTGNETAGTRGMSEEVRRWVRETKSAEEYGLAWQRTLEAQGMVFEGNTSRIKDNTGAIEQSAEAVEALSKANQAMIGNIAGVQSATDKYNESTAELQKKHADLQVEINNLIAQGWSPMSEKVLDLKQKQTELGDKMLEVQQVYSQALNQMVLDQIKLNLAVDGTFDSEDFQKYLDVAGAMGIMDEESIKLAKAQEELASMFTAGRLSAEELKSVLDMLSSGQHDIDVVMKMLRVDAGSSSSAVANDGRDDGRDPMGGRDYASGTGGQWLTVPQGYPNDTYPINLSSGEKFSVRKAGESGGGSGGGYSGPSAADIGAAVVGALESKGLVW